MLTIRKKAFVLGSIFCLAAAGSFFSNTDAAELASVDRPLTSATPSPVESKSFAGYKGLAIGAAADAVRLKLGEPKEKTAEQDLYLFSENESVQFYYNAGRAVTAIMITYTGNLASAPTARDVLGEDAPAKPDGSVFKMVRFPKAGYWISYNRSGGSDSIISIAIQKL